MLKGNYQQDIYFGALLGAFFGTIDGIFINVIYRQQLNSLFLKLAYIVYSLNFHAILGIIAGFIFGMISTLPGLKNVKTGFMKIILLLFVFTYFAFYTNVFLWNFNRSLYGFFRMDNLIDEIILLLPAYGATLGLCRLYQKTPSLIRLKWRNFWFTLVGAVLVDVIIGLTLGQGPRSGEADASIIDQGHKSKQVKYEPPHDFTPPKNLLIIVIDTLRADHLGCYGYHRNTSPFIDRLSRKGVLFENAIIQRPQTSPSIASLFTSLYVQDHGITGCRTELPDQYFTLAESYLKQGFITKSIVANLNVSSKFNFDQGFMDCNLTGELTDKGLANDGNQEVYVAAANWLEQNAKKPFFLYLHINAPHAPYLPPKKFDIFPADTADSPVIDPSSIPRYFPIEDNHYELNYYISKYDGEILYSDHLVEGVIKKLEQLHLKQNTLIILTADHGESLGDHGYYFQHGIFPYDACARVPLIVYYENGYFPTKAVQQTVEIIDIYPTVHEMMELPFDKRKIKGDSFLPLLLGKKLYAKKAFLESGRRNKYSLFYAVRDKRWKLIYNSWLPETHQLFNFNFMANIYRRLRLLVSAGFYPQRQNYELYDLEKDPQETKNIYRSDSQIASLLMKELNHKLRSKNRKFVPEMALDKMDQKTKESLKSLGYIQ